MFITYSLFYVAIEELYRLLPVYLPGMHFWYLRYRDTFHSLIILIILFSLIKNRY
jgi:hypothetical protein